MDQVIKIVQIFSVIFTLSMPLHAQINFSHASTKDLFDRLPESSQQKVAKAITYLSDDMHYTEIVFDRIPVVVVAHDNNLADLFIPLKGFGDSSPNDSMIGTFLGRSLLKLSLEKSIHDLISTAEFLQINIAFQGKDLIFTTISGFEEIYKHIVDANRVTILKNEHVNIVRWENQDNLLEWKFPNNFQLISGKNKKELDEELFYSLTSFSMSHFSQANRYKDLNRDENPILIRKGAKFMNLLSSDVYYKQSGNDSFLVYDDNYPDYSLTNLLLKKELAGDKTVFINHRIYGGRNEKYAVGLFDLISFFEKQQTGFVGIEDANPDSIEGTWIYYNEQFNFIHLLHFKTSSADIFSADGSISADLYSNIPLQNVSNLFGIFKPEKVSQKIEINLK